MNVSLNIQQIANGYLLNTGHSGSLIGHSIAEAPQYFETLEALKAALSTEIDAQIRRGEDLERAAQAEEAQFMRAGRNLTRNRYDDFQGYQASSPMVGW